MYSNGLRKRLIEAQRLAGGVRRFSLPGLPDHCTIQRVKQEEPDDFIHHIPETPSRQYSSTPKLQHKSQSSTLASRPVKRELSEESLADVVRASPPSTHPDAWPLQTTSEDAPRRLRPRRRKRLEEAAPNLSSSRIRVKKEETEDKSKVKVNKNRPAKAQARKRRKVKEEEDEEKAQLPNQKKEMNIMLKAAISPLILSPASSCLSLPNSDVQQCRYSLYKKGQQQQRRFFKIAEETESMIFKFEMGMDSPSRPTSVRLPMLAYGSNPWSTRPVSSCSIWLWLWLGDGGHHHGCCRWWPRGTHESLLPGGESSTLLGRG